MKTIKKLLILASINTLLGTQAAQATSTFSANSSLTITIDSITNNSNSGVLTGLDITGLFKIADSISAPGFGKDVTGDANASYSYTQSSHTTYNAGDSLSQNFSASGTASNGNVDTYYQSFGGLDIDDEMYEVVKFNNTSNDSFSIEYTLNYILEANVSGDFANTSIALDYYNYIGDIFGYETAEASTSLSLTDQNASTTSFTLTLGAFESDMFFADVSINSYAQAVAVAPVPVPAAGWLMLSGLALLRNYRKEAA